MEPDLTLKELAQITQRHIETLRQLCRMGKLPGAYRIGGTWRVAREAIDSLRLGGLAAFAAPRKGVGR